MISSLRGKLLQKTPTHLVIDVHGVGYGTHIPLSSYQHIGALGDEVHLLTYLHVREDILQLYGFATEDERRLFLLLISISGIGPRMAQTILSGISVDDFKDAIVTNNVDVLMTISGIGQKTAQRLIVELKGKFGDAEKDISAVVSAPKGDATLIEEAVLALVSLGYKRLKAREAVQKILTTDAEHISVEELIKKALHLM